MMPWTAMASKGFGAAYKKKVRDEAGAFIELGGFGEVLSRYENKVELDPKVKDRWGIPVLRFDYRFGDNEKAMCADMVDSASEMLEDAGIEVVERDQRMLTEGWSIHELGTARMGSDPKTSVLNQFQQSHDVDNLFVVDGVEPRQRGQSEPDLDHHGARLALLRSPRRRARAGEPVSNHTRIPRRSDQPPRAAARQRGRDHRRPARGRPGAGSGHGCGDGHGSRGARGRRHRRNRGALLHRRRARRCSTSSPS